jgi:hypothetical protein
MIGPISTSMTWPEVYRQISQLLIVPFLVIKLNEATPSSAEILFGLITKNGFATIIFLALYFPNSSISFGRHSSGSIFSTSDLETGFLPVILILI